MTSTTIWVALMETEMVVVPSGFSLAIALPAMV